MGIWNCIIFQLGWYWWWKIEVWVKAPECRPIHHNPALYLDIVISLTPKLKINGDTDIMLQNFTSASETSNTVELFMMYSDETDPLLSPFQNILLEAFGIWVEFQGVCVQTCNFNNPTDGFDMNRRRDTTNSYTVRKRSVYQVDALQGKLIKGFPLKRSSDPRNKFEESR